MGNRDPVADLSEVLYELTDGVGIVRLNKPEKRNALTRRMAFELAELLRALNEEDDVKVVIITGVAEAFCAGADLNPAGSVIRNYPIENLTRSVRIEPLAWWGRIIKTLFNYTKPVIAAVNGPAFGGGLGLACACDFRIASEKASFCSAFIRRGFPVETGLSFYLPRLIGFPRALELMMTGEVVDAHTALEINLARAVVPHHLLLEEALKFAKKFAGGPLVALAVIRREAYHSLETNDLAGQLAIELGGASVTDQTEDREESIRAFLEKREPQYRGI